MADRAGALPRAARAAARLHLPQEQALERIVDADPQATPQDLARAIAATYQPPSEDRSAPAMRRLLETVQDLGSLRSR